MNQGQKDALAMKAFGLLQEQVQARIVHYKGDMETSPELDAITAQVVQQLKEMQATLGKQIASGETPEEVESKHVATLTRLLTRV